MQEKCAAQQLHKFSMLLLKTVQMICFCCIYKKEKTRGKVALENSSLCPRKTEQSVALSPVTVWYDQHMMYVWAREMLWNLNESLIWNIRSNSDCRMWYQKNLQFQTFKVVTWVLDQTQIRSQKWRTAIIWWFSFSCYQHCVWWR